MKRYVLSIFVLCLVAISGCTVDKRPVVGIAWREGLTGSSYVGTYLALEAIGARPVLLGQVQSSALTYTDSKIDPAHIDSLDYLSEADAARVKQGSHLASNAEEVMRGIDAVVLTGGEDISPTLFRNPQPWHGIEAERDYNPTRDVSDYLLLQYCIEKDIPTLCICRGAQMLGVVSGAPLIQDIPTLYASMGQTYNYMHRYDKSDPDAEKDYVAHAVEITGEESLIGSIMKRKTIEKTPSWHHQAIGSLEGTNLVMTGRSVANGIEIAEVIERTDKKFIIGVQYHPEVVISKAAKGDEGLSKYMDQSSALLVFEALKEAVK